MCYFKTWPPSRFMGKSNVFSAMARALQSRNLSQVDRISANATCQGVGQRRGGWGGRNDRTVSERRVG